MHLLELLCNKVDAGCALASGLGAVMVLEMVMRVEVMMADDGDPHLERVCDDPGARRQLLAALLTKLGNIPYKVKPSFLFPS